MARTLATIKKEHLKKAKPKNKHLKKDAKKKKVAPKTRAPQHYTTFVVKNRSLARSTQNQQIKNKHAFHRSIARTIQIRGFGSSQAGLQEGDLSDSAAMACQF